MIGSSKSVPGEIHNPDLFEIVVDPDAEPGDVLGALARLLISLPQDGTSDAGSDSVPEGHRTQERRQAERQADVSRDSTGFDDT